MRNLRENELGDRMLTGGSYSNGGGIGMPNAASDSPPNTPAQVQTNPNASANTGDLKVPTPGDLEPDPNASKQFDLEKEIQQIKYKVTPDEIKTGLDYELRRMQPMKRKDLAKQLVIQNLKKNPQFYSKLQMMQVDENGIRHEAIYDIIREMKSKRDKKRNW